MKQHHTYYASRAPGSQLYRPLDRTRLTKTHTVIKPVSSHLYSDLEPGTAVEEHIAEVAAQAVVGPRLYRDADTLSAAALGVLNCLLAARGRQTWR